MYRTVKKIIKNNKNPNKNGRKLNKCPNNVYKIIVCNPSTLISVTILTVSL